ncbi:MAG TPA: hypothetical protein VGO40_15700 [Longimicrobium sp.]|jgi:hypothetical protein|nr:hypothetical protein [Longimicrobium sp.]
MREHGVEALLMGGQACVLYGAAEFSRDADFAILASAENLGRLKGAFDELQAEVVAIPPFEAQYLERGHAVHFRCRHPDAPGFRVDVMAHLRGVAPFADLWERRTSWDLSQGFQIDSLSLPDLVASKKTQRDKDWPMIRRLVEVSYDTGFSASTPERIDFWLRELRSPDVLVEAVRRFSREAEKVSGERAAVDAALAGDVKAIGDDLAAEEARERELDRVYWTPLKTELESLRHQRGRMR